MNTNGIISFGANFTQHKTEGFPIKGVSAVAPFWADVSTEEYEGRIYHRQVTDFLSIARGTRQSCVYVLRYISVFIIL